MIWEFTGVRDGLREKAAKAEGYLWNTAFGLRVMNDDDPFTGLC